MALYQVVEAIEGSPLPHGLLNSCAQVADVADPHELMGVEWLALGCCPVNVWEDPCTTDSPGEVSPGEESPGSREKEFCRPTVEHARPLTVYAAAECGAIGWSYAEAREQVLATLELGEQRAVEEGFWRNTLAPTAIDLTPPEGPVSIAQGVAALEGCLAESYGSQGLLHVPAGAAALLGCCNVVHRDPDGTLSTLAGNCVTISSGASAINEGPDGMPAEAGTAWLAISGPVVVRRGPVHVVPDRPSAAIDRFNTLRLIAERTYVAATTCTTCMIRIELCP